MATGDALLNNSGSRLLDASGNFMLDDGAGSTCCCGPTVPCDTDCSVLPTTYAVDLTGLIDLFCGCDVSLDPAWDGTMTYEGSCGWINYTSGQSIVGKVFAQAVVSLTSVLVDGILVCYWSLDISCWIGGDIQELWGGRKTSGSTPAGVYEINTVDSGICGDGSGHFNPPATLTVS